ncbi:hypothetical protein BLA39750_01307 [Burkholderia lata]|uniref:Uncharacterized protein n=1 Tax=Burkholderia lata (strain ATCC 17760 / DSM 23089 / LMG 22485 / NCIMB 9086 / R18194 / 383) TaxID=482957 RepID=A0A6P2VVY8_BURL3|nr:hypothetical protein [Burkholderia lata]VWC82522.1 hypothetical protein BLA39750_01307 [Burkholderia lata]
MNFPESREPLDRSGEELAKFIAKVYRDRDAEIAVIDRLSRRTRCRISWGYRKLFPLSMATLFIVGPAEYSRRTDRFQRFTRLALQSQSRLGGIELAVDTRQVDRSIQDNDK